MEKVLGMILVAIWFLVFMVSMVWVNTYVLDNKKNFGLTFVFAFSYLGLSWIIFKLIT